MPSQLIDALTGYTGQHNDTNLNDTNLNDTNLNDTNLSVDHKPQTSLTTGHGPATFIITSTAASGAK